MAALAGIKIIKIKAGGWHSLALSEHGDLYAWGWNDTGQLGMNAKRNGEENIEKKGQKNYAVPRPVDIYDDHQYQRPPLNNLQWMSRVVTLWFNFKAFKTIHISLISLSVKRDGYPLYVFLSLGT